MNSSKRAKSIKVCVCKLMESSVEVHIFVDAFKKSLES